jgi:hypothetical protein
MVKTLFICLLAMLITFNSWGEEIYKEEILEWETPEEEILEEEIVYGEILEEEIFSEENDLKEDYLKDISILDEQKIAYFSIKGNQISVHEGEKITFGSGEVKTWQVIHIEQGLVRLKSNEGLIEELRLKSPTPPPKIEIEQEKVSEFQESMPEKVTETASEKTTTEVTSEEKTKEKTVPSGYHIVHTPFGDFVVKDDPYLTEEAGSKPMPLNSISEDEVPSGHHIVRTPFGEFIVEDEVDK